jgi:uncharacterized protein (TIGR02099 family)
MNAESPSPSSTSSSSSGSDQQEPDQKTPDSPKPQKPVRKRRGRKPARKVIVQEVLEQQEPEPEQQEPEQPEPQKLEQQEPEPEPQELEQQAPEPQEPEPQEPTQQAAGSHESGHHTSDPQVPGTPKRRAHGRKRRRVRKSTRRRLVRVARKAGWAFLVVWFVCVSFFFAVRTFVLPRADEYRGWVASELSRACGLPVSLDHLEADWSSLRLRLRLGGVVIHDAGREVLRLEEVEATLAWSSLVRWLPYFYRLEILGPTIELGRGKDGVLSVGGIRIVPDGNQEGGNAFVAWLLGQRNIVVSDATLLWNDALRGARPLKLDDARFVLKRGFSRQGFTLRARPPARLATTLDVQGELDRDFDPGALATAIGHLDVALERADLGGWAAWVDYPFPLKGHGGVHLWIDNDGVTTNARADVKLDGIEARLAPGLEPLQLTKLDGNLQIQHVPGATSVSARGLWLTTGDGVLLAPADFDLRLRQDVEGAVTGGEFSAGVLDLAGLARVAGRLPIKETVRTALVASDPQGRVRSLSFSWQGDIAEPQGWTLKTKLEDAGLTARGAVPGAGGVSGQIEGSERGGRFTLASRDAHLDLPKIFEESRVPLATLNARGSWKWQEGHLAMTLDSADFSNEDAAGTASGQYQAAAEGPGEIDLTAKLTRADGAAVWRYLPLVIGPKVREWVKNAVQGKASSVKLELKGNLRDFPFRDGQGRFQVLVDALDARLAYAAGWPVIEDMAGELRFEGAGLNIAARTARIFTAKLEQVQVGIPDLRAGVMAIEGAAKGPSADFLRYIGESPLLERLGGFTSVLQTEGNGRLEFRLVMPLLEIQNTQVSGEYRFDANRIHFAEGWPALESAGGELSFTGEKLRIPSIHGNLFGAPLTLDGSTNASSLVMYARGKAEAAAVRKAFNLPLLSRLNGITDWQAELGFSRDSSWAIVRSRLDGLRSGLPAPFAKDAKDVLPLEVVAISSESEKTRRLTAKLTGRADILLERDVSKKNQIPPTRLTASIVDLLDVDAWRLVLDEKNNGGPAVKAVETTSSLAGVTLNAGRVRIFGRSFNALKMRAIADAEGWKASLDGTEVQGDVIWRDAGEGMLSARLRRLMLLENNRDENAEAGEPIQPPPKRFPGLDVRVEQFIVDQSDLGRLDVQASNRDQDGRWRLDKFTLRLPDSQLTGSGFWQPGEGSHTRLDFTLSTSNIGRLASGLGYTGIVRGGKATLSGQADWQGPPTRIDYPTLSGRLELSAQNGRFEKIEPGVGRLLAILSLQALPRRVTLDFRDVFSEGFIFDRITGGVSVTDGVMQTSGKGLEMVGPAARVRMQGQADLAAETQDLRVNVQPSLSDSVAVAAAVVNPAVGAAAYLADKALGNPINKIFAYDYAIYGKWSDPTVEKLTAPRVKRSGVGDEGLLQGVP